MSEAHSEAANEDAGLAKTALAMLVYILTSNLQRDFILKLQISFAPEIATLVLPLPSHSQQLLPCHSDVCRPRLLPCLAGLST